MLQLKNIKKYYDVGGNITKALDGISVSFRKKEFVSILGTSGSGKTTCLNIIGGLDRYDEGDLIINGKSTKDFKDVDWDAYRNNTIGFVFQSYNLISHLGIIENVELGMTLSGVSRSEKRKKAIEALEQVGLKEHMHKRPNQLSGGQMQRVAIARALANDPDVLLCDEPTGALDTTTSVQIMDLIKSLSKDRLVIMVTHNPELAEEYSDRIVQFSDGKIVSDSNPYEEEEKKEDFKLKKTSMSFITALRLSFNNIMTKKGRTALTAFASSIGIIGIAVILSLSSGFQMQIDEFQENALSEFPIIISKQSSSMDMEAMQQMSDEMNDKMTGSIEFADTDEVLVYDQSASIIIHKNDFNEEFMSYVQNINSEYCSSVGYLRLVSMNLVREVNGQIIPTSFLNPMMSGEMKVTSMSSAGLSSYPTTLDKNAPTFLEKNYDVLEGEYPKSVTDVVLVVDEKNRLDISIMKALGYNVEDGDTIKFADIVGTTFEVVDNDVYYNTTEYGSFIPSTDYESMYGNETNITLTITGVVRMKADAPLAILAPGVAYSDELCELVIELQKDSAVVKAQEASNTNVFTFEEIDDDTKDMIVASLGGTATPFMIFVYPTNFDNKEKVIEYLDKYNEGKTEEEQIVYSDLAATMSDMTSGIMDAITVVLIAFAAISLVVSLIMICIITYTSVLERTKEIGILKALGARKKDITRVFDAETCILGVFSGVLGITIAYLLTIPINSVILDLSGLDGVAVLKIEYAVGLVILSTVLTILGGHIPARMAAKKDAVEALRSE